MAQAVPHPPLRPRRLGHDQGAMRVLSPLLQRSSSLCGLTEVGCEPLTSDNPTAPIAAAAASHSSGKGYQPQDRAEKKRRPSDAIARLVHVTGSGFPCRPPFHQTPVLPLKRSARSGELARGEQGVDAGSRVSSQESSRVPSAIDSAQSEGPSFAYGVERWRIARPAFERCCERFSIKASSRHSV